MSETATEQLQAGKRYRCETCGGELICTAPGDGHLECCGAPMQAEDPKPMPSAD